MIKLIYEHVLEKKTEVNPRNYGCAFRTSGNMTSPYSTLYPNFVNLLSYHGYLITELESWIIWPVGGLSFIVLFGKRFSRNKACTLINNVLLHHFVFHLTKYQQVETAEDNNSLSLVHKYRQVADVLKSVLEIKKNWISNMIYCFFLASYVNKLKKKIAWSALTWAD